MLQEKYPYYLANRPERPNADLTVTNKYTGEVAARVALADAGVLDQAIAAAADAAAPMRRLSSWQRKAVLAHLAGRCRERAADLAEALVIEAGKPIQFARGEVDRLIDTIEIAAEESTRIYGEVLPLDISERADGYRGMWKRVPVGPCAFITPWNFPLNLVAHKIAPALACGCPFVLKPASATPIGALILGEILAETDLPPGAFSILPMKSSAAGALVERRADQEAELHRFAGSRLAAPRPGPLQARDARTGRQRGGDHRARCRSGRRRRAVRLRRLLPIGTKLHQRAADPGSRIGLRGVSRRSLSRRCGH